MGKLFIMAIHEIILKELSGTDFEGSVRVAYYKGRAS